MRETRSSGYARGARTTPKLGFMPKSSAIRAVRVTLLGRMRLQPSIPMARIVSRYNERVRQVRFEEEAPW
jgi:hypothetical protein